MNREEIANQYKWDLTQIYNTEEEFNQVYQSLKQEIETFSKHETSMAENASNFYHTLKTYYDISRKLEKLYVYTSLLFDTNTANNHNQSLHLKVSNLYDDWSKVSYFVSPTILKKDYSEIETYYQEEPKLLDYEILLKREFRYKEHTLSDIEEKLLSSMSKAMGNDYQTYNLLKDSDLKFGTIHDEDKQEVELTCSNYSIYIESKDREVRKEAFQTLYKTYHQFINTFASILSGSIKENITIAKIKKYSSAREWCLYDDELDTSIYDNLITSISNNMDILLKYYDLKKEVLGLKELHLYDI